LSGERPALQRRAVFLRPGVAIAGLSLQLSYRKNHGFIVLAYGLAYGILILPENRQHAKRFLFHDEASDVVANQLAENVIAMSIQLSDI
jgi:hypothetical protein